MRAHLLVVFEVIKIQDLCPYPRWWRSLFCFKKVYLWTLKWNSMGYNDSSCITSLHLHKRIYSTHRPQFGIIIKFESSVWLQRMNQMQRILLIKWCDLLRLIHKNYLEKGNLWRLGPGRRGWRLGCPTPCAQLKRKQSRERKPIHIETTLCQELCASHLLTPNHPMWHQKPCVEDLEFQPRSPNKRVPLWLLDHKHWSDSPESNSIPAFSIL